MKKRKKRSNPAQSYEVTAYYRWPGGQEDAAYDFIAGLPTDADEGAIGTKSQIAIELMAELNPNTAKFMRDEDATLVIQLRAVPKK